MSQYSTNILIIGKTGVGKSCLLNYIFDKDISPSGSGKPVTEQGIFEYEGFKYKQIEIHIYDSWGLEADKATKWRGILENEVDKHNKKHIKDWFHTIIYCIDAKRARIEQFEIDEIIKPLIDSGNNILFILTKSGIASENELNGVINVLNKSFDNPFYIKVDSLESKLRNGQIKKQFGRKEVLNTVCINLRKNLISKYKNISMTALEEKLNHAHQQTIKYYDDKAGIFVIYGEEFKDEIKNEAKRIYKNIVYNYYKSLEENFKFINNLSKALFLNFCHNYNYIYNDDSINNYFHTQEFEDWDNDFADYFMGIFSFGRENKYKSKIDDFLFSVEKKIRAEIGTRLNNYVNNLENNKIVVICPECKQKLSIPWDKEYIIICKNCSHQFSNFV